MLFRSSEIRGQFPGRGVSVTKAVGDTVRRGELLARIESSESLQVYPVHATVGGVVAERNANPGDVTDGRALYVITDPAQTTVVFNRSEEHTSELQSLMRISYAVFCLKTKNALKPRIQLIQLNRTFRREQKSR